MSDEHKQYASTAAATLEAHILSVHSAKSEAEWWAHREIEALRAENEKLRAALNRIDGMATTICMKNDAGYPIQLGNVMQIYQEARAAAALKETNNA